MSESQTRQLPPLRNGITFAFNDYDIEGKPQWLIHDASNSKFYLIGWLEHEIISRWHLGYAKDIIESILQDTTLHVEMNDIENFYKFLASHFLLRQSASQILNQAKEQNLFRNESIFNWLIGHYLFFRIPLCRPDQFLVQTAALGKILFSRITFYIFTALGIFALYQLSNRWDLFTHSFSTIFTLEGMFFYMIAFSVCKLLHEMGHAYMCRHFGVPVPTLGIAFLVFWPVLYTDTTLSWSLTSQQRLKIALAGMWAETYATIIAALIWCNTSVLTLKSICYLVISVNWIASLLINVSPFMRFDGYYVLADLLRMPNLQPRAFALTRWQLRKWLFDWPDPPPEQFGLKLRLFLIIYSILTWIYRFILYIGIAVLVYHFFIKIVGIILFAVEVYYFLLGPFVNEVKFWLMYREKFTFNLRTRITIIITLIIFASLAIPFSQKISILTTISYYHQNIYAPEPAILQTSLPAGGTVIKKGDIIATLYSPWLEEAKKEVYLNYKKTLNELRRTQINENYSGQKNISISAIDKQQSEYEKLQQRSQKLIIKAPFDGHISEAALDILPGTTLKKDEWLADFVDIHQLEMEGYIPEKDLTKIRVGQTGYFYPLNIEKPRISVTVKSIDVLNARNLNCVITSSSKINKSSTTPPGTPCYHISDFGGDVPVFPSDSGGYIPVDSVFRVTFSTDKIENLKYIEKGTVILKGAPRSVLTEFFYKAKKIWIEQSGF